MSASALAAEPWWDDRPRTLWVARRLYDHRHLGERRRHAGPWVLVGRECGRGPENEPLVECMKPVAGVAPEAVEEAARLIEDQQGAWGPLERTEEDDQADRPLRSAPLAPAQVRLLEYQAVLPSRTKIAAALVVYLIVAALVFVPVVRLQKVAPGRMAGLVVKKPPPGFATKPAAANTIKPSSSSFAAVKAAARKSKDSTGAYSVEWAKTGSNDAVSMVISYLPSPADAAKVQQEARRAYTSSTSLKSDAYTYVGPVAVPGIPGASAAAFKPSTPGNPPLVVVAFQEGRAQATVFAGLTAPPAAVESAAASFARSEYDHLRSALSGFSLVRTTWPALSAALYWVAAALLAAAGLAWPAMRRRAERRRTAAAERARMQHKTVRGSKIVKRQAGRKVPR